MLNVWDKETRSGAEEKNLFSPGNRKPIFQLAPY
jgi:hypothetical protein